MDNINKWKFQNNNIKKIINIQSGFNYILNNDLAFLKSLKFSIILLIINIIFTPNILSKFITSMLTIFIFLFELLNTIIELIVDRVGLDFNIMSKYIKDMSSLMVFLYISCYIFFIIFIIKYSYISYKKWKINNKNKNLKDYILYTFSV